MTKTFSMHERVAGVWLRKKVSVAEPLLENVRDVKQLPFRHLFGDKRRLVVPMPDLRTEEPVGLADDLQHVVTSALKAVSPEKDPGGPPRVNVSRGTFTLPGEDRELKIGKLADKLRRDLEKKVPELVKSVQRGIRNRRKIDKLLRNFERHAVLGMEETAAGVATKGGVLNPQKMLLSLMFKGQPRTPTEDENRMLTGLAKVDPRKLGQGNYAHKLEEWWARGMKQVLDPGDEDIEQLTAARDELLARAQRESRQTRREQLKLDADRLSQTLLVYENWPKEDRRRAAGLVQASTSQLLEAVEDEDSRRSEQRDLANDVSADDRSRTATFQNLEKLRQDMDDYRSVANVKDVSMIVSRDPVDVLRMADHPAAAKGMRSCQSPGGSYFHCTISEARGNGLVGYLVPTASLADVDLDSPEIFRDDDRGVKGIVPLSRTRFRRFRHKNTGEELAIPELATYGVQYENFSDLARDWARDAQPHALGGRPPQVSDYVLTGGDYRDNPDSSLFDNFFGRDPERPRTRENAPYQPSPAPAKDRGEDEGFWTWVRERHPEIANPERGRGGRKDRITPDTLKDYASREGPQGDRARQVVDKLRYKWNRGRGVPNP